MISIRTDVESLASYSLSEITAALASIEECQNADPANRRMDSAWRALRSERDYRLRF